MRFSYTMLMLFFQSVASVAFSLVAHTLIRLRDPSYGSVTVALDSGAPQHINELNWHLITRPGFTACAAFYLLAMACSNESLRFVSYPFQSLAKSCKLIPVMMSRVVLLRAKYPVSKVRAARRGGQLGRRKLIGIVCVWLLAAWLQGWLLRVFDTCD